MDIVFALDSSGSVGMEAFTDILNFVADVVDQYVIGPDSTRVSIVRYSGIAQLIISLDQFTTKETLVGAILNTDFIPGTTNTASAIGLARQQLVSNGRPSAKQILIVVTDGKSDDLTSTVSEANAAKGLGIEVFSMGIGSGINIDEINAIASTPVSSHVLTVADTSAGALSASIEELSQGICTGIISYEAIILF